MHMEWGRGSNGDHLLTARRGVIEAGSRGAETKYVKKEEMRSQVWPARRWNDAIIGGRREVFGLWVDETRIMNPVNESVLPGLSSASGLVLPPRCSAL